PLLRQEGLEGRELAVQPLSPAEQRELARRLLLADDPAADLRAEWVARQSEGYPFFVYELVQHLQAVAALAGQVPAAEDGVDLDEVLWGRVQRLPAEARVLLEVVAVAGQPVAEELACQAAGLRREERQSLKLLRSARLLRSAGPARRQEVRSGQ